MSDASPSAIEAATRRDEAAREIVRSHLDENIMVLAGAGAGKTHEMITRMVNLVRSGVSVDRMAAITFTKKAAGEMQGRFFDRLQSAAAEARPEEREHLERARQRIDRCYIGTIHSFCGRLLRERSLEAGLPPDFSEIDDREELDLRKTAWQRYLQTRDPDDIAALEDLGVSPEDLSDFFGDLCQFEDVQLYRPSADNPDLTEAVREVIDFIERVEPHIPERPVHEKGYDACQQAVLESRRFLEYHGLETDGDRAQLLQKFEGLASYSQSKEKWTDKLRYSRWGDRGSPDYTFAQKVGKEWLPELTEKTLTPVLEQWEAYVYDRAAEFTLPAVAFYREMRLEEGKLSFQDLLVRARDLLRDRPDVRTFFQQRYRHLFVDEFQDTDPIQAEILFYLTDDKRLEEKDWTKLTPRPGSLFLVGDGKQSIYRFRRADYETFNLVRRQLEASDAGRIITLQRCFRTYENLCGYVNDSFPDIFEQHGEPHQAPFEELLRVDGKTDGHTDGRVRRITVPYQYRNSSGEIASYDAGRIARFIASAVRDGGSEEKRAGGDGAVLPGDVGYGDFMILARTTTRLDTYAEALEELDIPYDVSGGGTLGESEELQALLDVLKAVYDPDNPVPLIAYLRGPLAGISDDELYEYSKAGGDFRFDADVPGALEEASAQRFREAFAALDRMQEWLDTQLPSAAIERFLEDRGILGFSAIQKNGSSRAGSLLKVMALVEELEGQTVGWIEVMDELQEIVDDDSYGIEEMTLEAGARDEDDEPTAVQVMNLHKAKGLEAPVVFLADPYSSRGGSHEPYFHVSRVGEEEPYVVLPVSQRNRYNADRSLIYRPKGWDEFAAEEDRFLQAEETRLLYVAATRAENLLVVSRYEDKDENIKDGYWGPLNSYLTDVPELEDCDPVSRASPDVFVDLDAVNQKRSETRQHIRRPSFEFGTVTGDTPEDEILQASGRGPDYGNLVHALFEIVVSDRLSPDEVPAYLEHAKDEYEVSDRQKSAAVSAVERLVTSGLWDAVEAARNAGRAVYTEVPLARRQDSAVTTGQIDLVFETEDGWQIVDYKTEVPGSPDALDAVRSRYESQLSAYAEHWKTMGGAPVINTQLWLTESGDSVDVW